MDVAVLSDDGSDGGFYIVAALQVLPDGAINHCYMDVSFPERINDYAYFIEEGQLHYGATLPMPREKIIPAIAFDCFSVYEMFFYVEAAPEIGIGVLKRRGLRLANRKQYISP